MKDAHVKHCLNIQKRSVDILSLLLTEGIMMGINISMKYITYMIPCVYLFELVTIRLLATNNFVALGIIFINVSLIERFFFFFLYDLHVKSSF